MRAPACLLALLLAPVLGCNDVATIGGLCPRDCSLAPASGDCARFCDASTAIVPDACAAGGCSNAPDSGAGGDAGPACAERSHELTRMRADLMLIVDDSLSLAPWWPFLNDGLLQFLQTTEPTGIGIGLQRFDEVCEADYYLNPVVPLAPLPDNRAALMNALPFPGVASTSTVPALDGVLQYARTEAASHADSSVSVVLLTDASPGACDGLTGDYEGEAQRIARAAYEGTPAIKTYVVGFSTLPTPGLIAPAGGTELRLIGVAPADGDVLNALEGIRRDAQPCAFAAPAGSTLEPDSIVTITAADGTARSYPVLATAAACDPDGFIVENPAAPFPLVACPQTCASLAPDERATVSNVCPKP